jgi:Tfp pilus assembly protein PilF
MPALQGEPIWDDSFLARDNPFIKSPVLFLETFRHYLQIDSFSAHYRPMQNISYMLDYAVWHTNWYGFHLSNVFWHVGSGILLYLLLRELIGAHWLQRKHAGHLLDSSFHRNSPGLFVAFFVALLWLVHPVHSAAVDYISGRADSLAFFFASASWLSFLHARKVRSIGLQASLYVLASVLLLAALCSRESALMWIIVFFLHLVTLQKNVSLRGKCCTIVACLLVVTSYAGLRRLPAQRPSSNPTSEWTPLVRSTLMLRSLGDYGRLMVFPGNLHMERTVIDPRQMKDAAGWRDGITAEYLSILGLVVGAGLLCGSVARGRARSLRAFGAAWFILSYLPISNVIELNATVAEHWLYVPSVGFLLFLAGCVMELPPRLHKPAAAFACCFAAALSARSYVRSTDWVTAEQFYERTIFSGGTSVRVALNLGYIYSQRGDLKRAESVFRKILQAAPDFLVARNNLADSLERQGKTEEANAVFKQAVKDSEVQRKNYPRTWMAALNYAHNQLGKGQADEALEVLHKANTDYPGTWPLVALEAEILRKDRGPAPAIEMIQAFAEERWWHGVAWQALGRLRFEAGDLVGAEDALRHAARLDVHDAESFNTIALMAVKQNRLGDAYAAQQRAVARQPDEPRQYLMLSDILTKMGRTGEAEATLAQVTRLQSVARSQSVLN